MLALIARLPSKHPAIAWLPEASVRTSTEMMQKIRREIAWEGGVWFLWGLSQAVGRWLQIDALKPEKDGGVLWFAFGAMVVLTIFLADCTEAILARIGERAPDEAD
jgi:hypothetical protein